MSIIDKAMDKSQADVHDLPPLDESLPLVTRAETPPSHSAVPAPATPVRAGTPAVANGADAPTAAAAPAADVAAEVRNSDPPPVTESAPAVTADEPAPVPPEPGRIEPTFASAPAKQPVLIVEDLRVSFPSRDGGRTEAVRGVSFTLGRERLGIVGESGSGKSQTGRAILGLTAPEGLVTAKRLEFHGTDLLRASPAERRDLRGGRIAMVLQDPKFSLNPVMTIGKQITETLHAHGRVSSRDARTQALAALAAVQIDQPERVYKLYPHEVSGGMGQRAMIAMMLIANPELLIADEPTSALDVTVQLQVLGILDALVIQRGMGLIFISHDLRLVSTFCDRILVMYAGKVVEEIAAGGLADAKHPYTRGLLNCLPQLADRRHPLPTLDRQPEWAL